MKRNHFIDLFLNF